MINLRLLFLLASIGSAAIIAATPSCTFAQPKAAARALAVIKGDRGNYARIDADSNGLRDDPKAQRLDRVKKEDEQRVTKMLRDKRLFPFGQRRIVAYAGMRYNALGKPRIKEMISRLEDLGVNCYSYLIEAHSKEDLSALPHFCDLASKAGIEVWVVLVPPTEESKLPRGGQDGIRYPPYGPDYVEWAKDISAISKKHPNLTMLMIDDFLYNVNLFTPEYVRRMYKTLKQENRKFLLGLTIYEDQLARKKEIDSYKPYIGAVEWGYQHKALLSPNYGISAKSLPVEIKEFGTTFPNSVLIPCLYFTPHSSWSRKATVPYLKESMTLAYQDAGVALIFRTPVRGTVNYDLVKIFCRDCRKSYK